MTDRPVVPLGHWVGSPTRPKTVCFGRDLLFLVEQKAVDGRERALATCFVLSCGKCLFRVGRA